MVSIMVYFLFNQKRNNETLASKEELQSKYNLKIKLENFFSLRVSFGKRLNSNK